LIINRGAAHPYENQAGWAVDMSECVDYQAYGKYLLLTLSVCFFNREDGVGINEGRAVGGGWN
jgi:hypothetical protein